MWCPHSNNRQEKQGIGTFACMLLISVHFSDFLRLSACCLFCKALVPSANAQRLEKAGCLDPLGSPLSILVVSFYC